MVTRQQRYSYAPPETLVLWLRRDVSTTACRKNEGRGAVQAMTLSRTFRGVTRGASCGLYALILVAGAGTTRFWLLGERVMSHDESLHTRYAYNLYADGSFQHTPLMHGPILFHATAFFYFLFGASDFTARIYTAALGVMVVLMPALFRPWLGRSGALLASILLLISPVSLYYHRYIRHDTPSIFFALLLILRRPDVPQRAAARAPPPAPGCCWLLSR